MIQSIVHFVSFLKSIERKILLQKWLPYSDRFGVKKTFLVTLYKHSSSKIQHLYALLSTYLSGEHSKKTCQASEKTPQNPGLVVLSIYFPIFHPSRCCFQTRFRAETRTNIWCRDFHEIRASYSYSILPEHRAGLGWSQNEIYGFLAVGKICT